MGLQWWGNVSKFQYPASVKLRWVELSLLLSWSLTAFFKKVFPSIKIVLEDLSRSKAENHISLQYSTEGRGRIIYHPLLTKGSKILEFHDQCPLLSLPLSCIIIRNKFDLRKQAVKTLQLKSTTTLFI